MGQTTILTDVSISTNRANEQTDAGVWYKLGRSPPSTIIQCGRVPLHSAYFRTRLHKCATENYQSDTSFGNPQ